MNSSFFIARRYLFSRKTHNVINIISGISVLGITISTAALVIVLSAFNGIENLVISLFSTFEPDIKIESTHSKTFDRHFIPQEVYEVEGLANYSEVIEEIAIIRHEDQFVIGTLKGVEKPFLSMSEMDQHLEDGLTTLGNKENPLGLVGVGALEKLSAYIFEVQGPLESFTIYSPNKDKKISRNSTDAFSTSQIGIVGTFSYNNDVDEEILLVPIDFAADIMNYENQITAVEMKFKEGVELENKKLELLSMLGDDFRVVTNLERNQLIYQTSKSEKWITTLLLAFIFFLATFNMVASITMLVLEKKDNLATLTALGAKRVQLQRIFFYEGLLINGLGLIFGLGLGYLICYLQMTFGFITMEGGHSEFFPIAFKFGDLILILSITLLFGTLAAFLPSKFLIRRIVK
ncbi:MAG: FtsX-like permease family protein [Flavobacteriales bacterium]|nr:FtsX-like permease family protein [Flavobacteriales bacterium]